jgi:hypothetical protein
MASSFKPVKNQIAERARSTFLSFPDNESTHGMLLNFREYSYVPGTQRTFATFSDSATTDIKASIYLPLPSNIADSYEVRIERFDQGIFGDIIASGGSALVGGDFGSVQEKIANMGLPSVESATRAASSLIGGLAGFLASKTTAGVVVGSLIGGDLGTNTIASNIGAGTGILTNPKAALAFKGIEMKKHNFVWTLAPKSPRESETLRGIINTIKQNVLPSYTSPTGGESFQRALFKYPSYVDCFFVGLDPVYYYYFKPALVNSFNIDYAPNNVSILRGGKPAAVTLTMSMIESDIHTADDYDNPTDPFEGL